MPGKRIDHVAVAVNDADAASEWWETRLDLVPVHDEVLPDVGVRLRYLAAGPTMVQLVQPTGPGQVADFIAEQGEGLHHVCFGVADIHDELAAIGNTEARVFRGGRSRRCSFLADRPNSVLIELTENDPLDGT